MAIFSGKAFYPLSTHRIALFLFGRISKAGESELREEECDESAFS
jgi:hypothetical protein